MNGEDRRAAATLIATVTGHLITTALAVVAVLGAFLTFTLDKRDVGLFFFVCIAVSALLLLLSIIVGVYSADRVLTFVAIGSLPPHLKGTRWQLILLVAGVVVVPVSFVFFGQPKEDTLDRIQNQLVEATEQIQTQEDDIQRLNDEVAALKEA